ncbi:alpha/beta hydrolase fold domain-containing protein [Rhodococcus sp. X156]|uniref:alpha/beta hydrolase n=1 Tax=Rhodococcus sp. X156 TaxID=2499145 RepID=UPI000FD9A802|nr:alpha/beta hydrolase fold domain-containing protein [Rhodococcus sp. X156]
MVMGARVGVAVASAPIAVVDVVGLGGTFAAALARTALRAPWRGNASVVRNVAVSTTRECVRSLIGYMTSLPIDEFRALERVLDGVSGVALPPFVRAQGVRMEAVAVADVPGLWFRAPDTEPVGTIVYLHGGGYIGTSPTMYAVFMAYLARTSRCDVFVPDYRLAPEYPYPAATEDVVAVIGELLAEGEVSSDRLFLAGDSGGGGLAGSVLNDLVLDELPLPAGVVLFSPEVSMVLNEPSVQENAALDVLPWNVPTNPYLHGHNPEDPSVSLLHQDLSLWPPTFVSYGSDEIFRDAIRSFVQRLAEHGVPHEAHEVAEMFHVFPFLLPWAQESRTVYRQVGKFIAGVMAEEAIHPGVGAAVS